MAATDVVLDVRMVGEKAVRDGLLTPLDGALCPALPVPVEMGVKPQREDCLLLFWPCQAVCGGLVLLAVVGCAVLVVDGSEGWEEEGWLIDMARTLEKESSRD